MSGALSWAPPAISTGGWSSTHTKPLTTRTTAYLLHRCANTLALLCATRPHIAHPQALSLSALSPLRLSHSCRLALSLCPRSLEEGTHPRTPTRVAVGAVERVTHTHIHTKLPSRAGSVRGDDSHLVHAHCTHQPIAAASPPPAGAIRRSGIRVSLLLGVASL